VSFGLGKKIITNGVCREIQRIFILLLNFNFYRGRKMLINIVFVQFVVFGLFVFLERVYPARYLPRSKNFCLWWLVVGGFALVWLRVVFLIWAGLPHGPFALEGNVLYQGGIFYLIYSFCNYWIHRFKHANPFLWRTIHVFHHSPSKMETMVAFFKHPLEIIFNTVCIMIIGWFFSLPVEAVAVALAIEGCLEIYHHSNIKTPARLRWIGYIIQIPEMHLVHHQYGLHKYNYVAFLWDSVFGTVRIPQEWHGKQGFNKSFDTRYHFFLNKT